MKSKQFFKPVMALFLIVFTLAYLLPFNLLSVSGANTGDTNLSLYKTDGNVRMASGDFSTSNVKDVADLLNTLQSLKSTFGINNAKEEFEFDKQLAAPFGYTFALNQQYKGYTVYGRAIKISTDVSGEVLAVSGNYLKDLKPKNKIVLTPENAAQIAEAAFDTTALFSIAEVYSINTKAVYAYNVSTTLDDGTNVFVDAQTGKIIACISSTHKNTPSVPHATYQTDYYNNLVEAIIEKAITEDGTKYYLADCLRNIYLFDSGNVAATSGTLYESDTDVFTDKVAISAFVNFVKAFDFYTNPMNIGVSLRGIDGSVNLTHDDAAASDEIVIIAYMHYSVNYENAAYVSGLRASNPKEAVFIFGDGTPRGMFDLAIALDVVGHEYQHAVTGYSAGLIYLNASGAINEGVSDVFGALIEGHEPSDERFWLIGETIVGSAYDGALRDMSDPNRMSDPYEYKGDYFYPFCYKDHTHSDCDNGGVHYNSSIVNHAAYQMWKMAPNLFTKKVMGTLWYSTLMLLQPDAEFEDLRVAMHQAAKMLNYSENIINTIGAAFDYVGIYGTDGMHTVTFDQTDFQGATPTPITRMYGEKFTVPVFKLSKEGFTIAGWSASGTVNDKVYYNEEEYVMPAYDMVLKPVVIISAWNNIQLTTFTGIGLLTNPYLIQNEADLATLAYYLNNPMIESPKYLTSASFKLTADLDLQNIPWVPIGLNYVDGTRTGGAITFDGDNHKIYNLKIIDNPVTKAFNAQGLFGKIPATITNLGIESGSINSSANFLGSFAGILYGNLDNCYSKINVTNTYDVQQSYEYPNQTGGLVGRSYIGITNSFYSGTVAGKDEVGGLAGTVVGKIENSYNSGNVTGGVGVGGLVGAKGHPASINGMDIGTEIIWALGVLTIGNSYNTGTITGEVAGGIGGCITDTYIANCINLGNVNGISANSVVGGIAGLVNYSFEFHFSSPIKTYNESSYITGNKSTGIIDQSTAFAGGIVGKMFDDNVVGYVFYSNNTYKAQSSLADIGNYSKFGAREKAMFKGTQAKSSTDNAFSGDFNFANAGYYQNEDNWSQTGWSYLYGIGTDWETTGAGSMPVPKKNQYWSDSKTASFASGTGTQTNPYRIATAGQLALLAHIVSSGDKYSSQFNLSGHFVLSNDIDLGGKVWSSIGCTFTQYRGSTGTPGRYGFNGTFDGNGFVIKNMYAREHFSYEGLDVVTVRVYEHAAGLFGVVSNTVKNVIIENCDLAGGNVGGIAANAIGNVQEISNCEVRSGTIIGTNSVGGIVGQLSASATTVLRSLVNRVKIAGSLNAGGIVGNAETFTGGNANLTFEGCINLADVFSTGRNNGIDGANSGGILGASAVSKLTIRSCINNANVTNNDFYGSAGGLLGNLKLKFNGRTVTNGTQNITLTNSISNGNVTYLPSQFSNAGAIIGGNFIDDDWTSCNINITLSNINFNSNMTNPVPTDLKNRNFVTLSQSGVVYSQDQKNYDFGNENFFVNSTCLNLKSDMAKTMYLRFNNLYRYTFYAEDGSIIKEGVVSYGTVITAPADPVKAATAEFTYTFTGWSNYTAGAPIKGDGSYKATFTSTVNEYTYTFYADDGETVIKQLKVKYGTTIVAPEDLEKESDLFNVYTFKGWENFTRGKTVTGDISFIAMYDVQSNPTGIIIIIVAGVVVLAAIALVVLRKQIFGKKTKAAATQTCGGNCEGCSGHDHDNAAEEKCDCGHDHSAEGKSCEHCHSTEEEQTKK